MEFLHYTPLFFILAAKMLLAHISEESLKIEEQRFKLGYPLLFLIKDIYCKMKKGGPTCRASRKDELRLYLLGSQKLRWAVISTLFLIPCSINTNPKEMGGALLLYMLP